MLKIFYVYSIGKDSQLADSADNIATAMWDMVFPVLCKVVGYILCIMLVRSLDIIFYYVCLRVGCNWIFILILDAIVFTTLHNYHSSSGSLTLKTHTFVLELE